MSEETMITEPVEQAMETQDFLKKEEGHKNRFNKIHVLMISLMAIQVLFLMTFSEPMSIFWGSHPLFNIYDDDVINRSARIIMIYHSLANPFVVANTFWIMEYYETREKFIPALKLLLIPGAFLSGLCGMVFAYTRVRIFHELFYFGLFLIFCGGVLYIIAAFPIAGKFPDPKNETPGSTYWGWSLENYSLVILAFCVLVSTIYAGLAAMENFTGEIWQYGRETDAFFAEEVVKVLHHDLVEEFIVSHLHIQLALSSAMVVMIGYKASKIQGKIYNVILWVNPVGILTISYGAWVLNHYLIWVGAGLLILNTTAMAIKGWIETSKKGLGDAYATASAGKKIKGIFSDSIRFGLYFIFLYAQIVVTICGIIIGLQTREVYRTHEYVQVEYDFNVGHWHLLAVLIATLLLFEAINHFKVKSKARQITGWLLSIGGCWAFTFANAYMMRDPATDYDPAYFIMGEYHWTEFLTFVGVWILTIGYILGITLVIRQYRRGEK